MEKISSCLKTADELLSINFSENLKGSCSTKSARIFFSQASARSNLCQVGKMSLTADDGRTHPKPDQGSFEKYSFNLNEKSYSFSVVLSILLKNARVSR